MKSYINDFVHCIAWRATADQVAQMCLRGCLIEVDGRLQTRSFDLPDGSRRHLTKVVVQSVRALDTAPFDPGTA